MYCVVVVVVFCSSEDHVSSLIEADAVANNKRNDSNSNANSVDNNNASMTNDVNINVDLDELDTARRNVDEPAELAALATAQSFLSRDVERRTVFVTAIPLRVARKVLSAALSSVGGLERLELSEPDINRRMVRCAWATYATQAHDSHVCAGGARARDALWPRGCRHDLRELARAHRGSERYRGRRCRHA